MEKMNWEAVFDFPSEAEIENYQKTSCTRSPYIAGWLVIPEKTKYTEYSVDFRADYLPEGTYCSLGSWKMDYSYLENLYESISIGNIHAYAGFQNLEGGEKVGIMSFWDVYGINNGTKTTIRAERLYPKVTDKSEAFAGEGTGAHCIVPYKWKAEHWYRMHLRCVTSKENGNTIVEQWVCDLETGVYTLLCAYDTKAKGAMFEGSIAVFLENFLTQHAGEIRTMEVCNAKYLDANTKKWKKITEAYLTAQGGLPSYEGSYNFGSSGDRFWMITSGVGGDWYNNGNGKMGGYYTVK